MNIIDPQDLTRRIDQKIECPDRAGKRLLTVVGAALLLVLGGCGPSGESNGEPSPEELAAEQEEDQRLAEEAREREREANRQRMMEELRQQDAEEARREQARAATAAAAAKDKGTAEGKAFLSEQEWEDRIVARLKMIGTGLGSIQTADGRSFEGVMIKSARADGLTLYHEGGTVDLHYADLAEDLRSRFLYDAREAGALAAGQVAPELSPVAFQAIQDRIARERAEEAAAREREAADAEKAESSAWGEEGDPETVIGDGSGDFEDPVAEGSALLAKRREVAQELNQQVNRLTLMQDAGYKADSAAVRKQEAVIAQWEAKLKAADAAVMEARRGLIEP